ncbi:MAG TPA: cell cycle transcriptional regulator TrcR, partial [Methylovirgula sp.]|nr:cell cycle transcriptional regulator TrcR [Methylovirgula sp.]
PMDPVTLGLCSQMDLDFEVNRAAKERVPVEEDRSQTLMPAEVTTREEERDVFATPAAAREQEPDIDVDSVFSKLKTLKEKE